MSISLHSKAASSGAKVLKSIHGKALLAELSSREPNLQTILEYIQKDPHAGRLKQSFTNENAFHLLLNNDFLSANFVLTVLRRLIDVCPKGVQDVCSNGSLPLHVALRQRHVIEEAVLILIKGNQMLLISVNFITFTIYLAYPDGSKAVMEHGIIPLFLAVMRDDASVKICKALCEANPLGPSTMNQSRSYPLHFACRRQRPNLTIIKLLIHANPLALSHINDYGLHPLHCITSTSDNIAAVECVYHACPEAIAVPDRQGRTCLHLAVMLVGKDHEKSVITMEDNAIFEYEQDNLIQV